MNRNQLTIRIATTIYKLLPAVITAGADKTKRSKYEKNNTNYKCNYANCMCAIGRSSRFGGENVSRINPKAYATEPHN